MKRQQLYSGKKTYNANDTSTNRNSFEELIEVTVGIDLSLENRTNTLKREGQITCRDRY